MGETVNESVRAEDSSNLDKTGAWLRAIETGDRALIRSPFSDGLQTLALIDAAVQSRDTGRFIHVEEL